MSIKCIHCTQRERGDHETLCISHRDAEVIEFKNQCPIAATYEPWWRSLPYIPRLNTIFIHLRDLWPRYADTWGRLYTFRIQNLSKVVISQNTLQEVRSAVSEHHKAHVNFKKFNRKNIALIKQTSYKTTTNWSHLYCLTVVHGHQQQKRNWTPNWQI